jgi:hypothetical protein
MELFIVARFYVKHEHAAVAAALLHEQRPRALSRVAFQHIHRHPDSA